MLGDGDQDLSLNFSCWGLKISGDGNLMVVVGGGRLRTVRSGGGGGRGGWKDFDFNILSVRTAVRRGGGGGV